ncbi:hypothetical protein CISG_06599 [Coccidioides immitis RMSCC 3703]|uniref:Uncharacterized protein n=1 Tax=Coccidioides immitis RMSCC 3703 TaxID=454286 RepID=A0A0J8R3S1_COCIT|nr:hypothetical protein CISG_06599 [Coccidioides immitis RMSCC 3703]
MPPQQGPSMPRDVKALQRHGESQYRWKNYKNALEAFSKALALGRGDSVALLNGRAAAHCALGDLKAGLRDGKQMIRIDKSDPRGYLRTAKILQLMQKFEEAHKLYFYSLRMIDEHAPERKQIEALMLKTKKRIIPPKRVDPLTVLAPELVSMILEHLDLQSTFLKALAQAGQWPLEAVEKSQPYRRQKTGQSLRSASLCVQNQRRRERSKPCPHKSHRHTKGP